MSAVVYRAFVFAAPPVFRRAQALDEMRREPFPLVWFRPSRGNAITFLTSH
ncbi:MAG: hypothetical protein ABSG02_21045 [Terriglobales bacterium]